MLPPNCQSEQLCNKSHVGQMFYLFFDVDFAFENNFYRSPDDFWLRKKKKELPMEMKNSIGIAITKLIFFHLCIYSALSSIITEIEE